MLKQGVALTGRNRTDPPCSVGCPTADAPGPAMADRPRAWRPAGERQGELMNEQCGESKEEVLVDCRNRPDLYTT